jgi:hypothetical protein
VPQVAKIHDAKVEPPLRAAAPRPSGLVVAYDTAGEAIDGPAGAPESGTPA